MMDIFVSKIGIGLINDILRNNIRCLSTSRLCLKKGKNKSDQVEKSKIRKEAPYIFKAVSHAQELDLKRIGKDNIKFQIPFLFKPITVNKLDLEDEHSSLLQEFERPSLQTEKVFIIQPNFKWGKHRFTTKLEHHRLAEAKGLIESIKRWSIHSTTIESIHDIHVKLFFGTGKVIALSEKIRDLINEDDVTMVFVNVEQLSVRQIKELEAAFGCKVFDRYRVVLELFKERAHTREAKLQVQLAEIQYLRTHLVSQDLDYDQQRGGGKGFFGTGETKLDQSKLLLATAESRIKKALQHIKTHRAKTKEERVKKKVPHVALVGYTNAGKTTLGRVLSHDERLKPEDMLFATLDTTAHRGKLPSGLNIVYVDTVGFISELPHDLVESFSTTLEDVKTADLLVHISDISHPEYDMQKATVESVLGKLNLPSDLLKNKIHVLNKADLRSDAFDTSNESCLTVSCKFNTGIEELRSLIEKKILDTTQRNKLKINIDQTGQELSWLYRHGTIIDTSGKNDGSLDIVVLLDPSNKERFEREFGTKLSYE